jgi:hypothetical protein
VEGVVVRTVSVMVEAVKVEAVAKGAVVALLGAEGVVTAAA